MLTVEAFAPVPNGTVSVSASGTTFATAILSTTGLPTAISMRVHNAGPYAAFYELGGVPNTTSTIGASIPIPVGAIEVVNCAQSTYASACCAAGQTATVYFTRGYGL